MPMNLSRCMTRECKNCKYEMRCFKEYRNEYSKNKNRKSKTGRIQSKNRFKTRKYRILKDKEKSN